MGVLVIDLDRFKSLNDRLGHAAGDQLLRAVGRRIEAVSRTSDSIGRLAPETVARLGGDEFVVLCEDLRSAHDATRLADRIVTALAEPVAVDGGREVSIRASVGVSVATGGECRSEALIRQADAAKYRAKQRGGARFEVFDETVRDQVLDRLDKEKDLRGALDRGEFKLVYQPIVATSDGRVVGVEALLRWHHPELGTVPPDQFIPLAEQTGLIVPIGRWALHEACRQAARWRSAHRNLSWLLVSVNLSARQFADPELTADVREAIFQSGIDPGALCLEMTESALVDESERAVSILDGLRALGVRIALDDFGTGYSSLSYLQRFPLDGLKLDRSFMSGMAERPHSRAIVAAVIDMARTLGLRVVAEGVETEDQLADLRALEAEFAQGYHFARPLPAEDLGELFESGTVIERGRVVIPS